MDDYHNSKIIGFDLGHGETALTWVSSENNEPPQSFKIYNDKCQITAVAHHEEKGTIIGERAFFQSNATDFQIAFKKRPCNDLIYEKTLHDFVKEIYQHLIATRQIEPEEKNLFFVGCPSGWSEQDIKAYEQLLTASDLPNVTVVKESRAALMHAKESGLFSIEQLNKSVLVIDLGSSTTDYTLVKGMTEHPIDFGYDLGASLIDKLILAKSLAKSEHKQELKLIFEQEKWVKNQCELTCRKTKEKYFCYPDLFEDQDLSLTHRIQKTKYSFESLLNGEIMREILQTPIPALDNKSWPDAFREQLQLVKQKLEQQGIEPSAILLTGGASKMGFIPQICQEIFPNSPYKPDGEPELCIARGLSRWGRVDIHTAQLMNEVNQFLENQLDNIIKAQIPALRESLTDVLVNGLLDEVLKPCILSWRNGDIKTLNDLDSKIKSKAEDWLTGSQAKQRIANQVSEWFNKVGKEVGQKAEIICTKYGLPPGQLAPKPVDINVKPEEVSGGAVIIDPTILTLVVVVIVDVVVSFVSLVIIGILADILILLGLIGVIIAWTALILSIVVGHQMTEEMMKNYDIPKIVRGTVSDKKISKMVQKSKPTLKVKIQEMFDKDASLVNGILQTTKEGIRAAVKEQADRARLLIS